MASTPRRRESRRFHLGALVASAVLIVLTAAPAAGAPARPQPIQPRAAAAPWNPDGVTIRLTRLTLTFSNPVLITNAADGSNRLFVVEQGGRIRIIRNGTLLSQPFLDLSASVSTGGERGLLGLAFHPSFETNGRFYVNFTNTRGDTAINEYRVTGNPDRVDWRTGRRLMTIGQPASNHNGGHLAFGPDGYLYIATGDGGGGGDPANHAQRLDSVLGKLLRIDVDVPAGSSAAFRIPSDNPYVGRTGLDHIWARGFRNPWRFSFDRRWGTLWVADVGEGEYEEVNRITPTTDQGGRGRNYGWRILEGRHCHMPATGCSSAGTVLPTIEYRHTVSGEDNCSVTGGYASRGGADPALYGAYLYGDFCSGRIWGIYVSASPPVTPRLLLDTSLNIVSFGEDEHGKLYVVDRGGDIYRIDSAPA